MKRWAWIAVLTIGLLAAPADRADTHELIFAEVQANGHTGSFLVDTGAPTSLLDAEFAESIGVRLGADRTLRGGGGLVKGRMAEGVAIQAKGGPRLTLDAPVTDLSAIAQVFGRPLDGVLGADYFANLVVRLDYRMGLARFDLPSAVSPPARSTPLRIVITPFVQAVAKLGGREAEGSFQIDTGANTAVAFWSPFARKAFAGVRTTPGQTMGLAGSTRSRLAPLERLDVAGLSLEGLTADLTNDLRPNDAPPDFLGAIGGPAFAGRILHLDFARARMWVE